jgi:dipeptidyl-peptidase-3
MRIKGEGDFKAGKALVDTYGTKVDAKLHQEVLKRMKVLDIPSSSGFVQPELTAVSNSNGEIIDVKVSYPSSLEDQMLRFSGKRK